MQQCILSYNNREEVIELPVPLQEWSLESSSNTYNFTTLVQGDIKAIGADKLKTLSIDSFFPRKSYSFLLNRSFQEPETYINMIEKWRLSKRPIRVVIVGTNINYAFAIESFKISKSDPTDDVYFSLDLEEYKFLNTPIAENPNTTNDSSGLKNRPHEKQKMEIYTFKNGDTLIDISSKMYGDPKYWEQIAKVNKIKDPYRIEIGSTIEIPAMYDGYMTASLVQEYPTASLVE